MQTYYPPAYLSSEWIVHIVTVVQNTMVSSYRQSLKMGILADKFYNIPARKPFMKQIGVFENGWEEVSSTTVQYYVVL